MEYQRRLQQLRKFSHYHKSQARTCLLNQLAENAFEAFAVALGFFLIFIANKSLRTRHLIEPRARPIANKRPGTKKKIPLASLLCIFGAKSANDQRADVYFRSEEH